MGEQSVPRMRTIQQAADYFKEQDPETQVTFWKLRGLVLKGELPYICSGKAGKTKYINLDVVINYFNGSSLNRETKKVVKFDGKIRKTV
ncbi:hypothetical protein [Clostridium sp. HBUAS56010]|uniref:hypothetical protein n=1 Tax=Clostridium sp. HBUAS56010 TaxID=2571127 RepID=UPI00163DA910|nr:hypothetical protein [Clostridium sp. HBUAS56010]